MKKVLGFATLALAACQSNAATEPPATAAAAGPAASSPATASRPPAPDPDASGLFFHAPIIERTGPIPPAFSADLPPLVGLAEWPANAPPRAFVEDALCWGDARMRTGFVQGLTAAGRVHSLAAAVEAYEPLVDYCRDPSRCDWAAGLAPSHKSPAVRAVMWKVVAACRGGRYDALFDHSDAPEDALLEHVRWTRGWGRQPPRAWPRLLDHVRALEQGDVDALERAASTLAEGGDAATGRALVERFAALPAGPVKAAYGRAACAIRSPEADAACAVGCKGAPDDFSCSLHFGPNALVWPADLATAACDPSFPHWRLDQAFSHRRAEIVAGTFACLTSDRVVPMLATEEGQRALHERVVALAVLDHPRAHAAAKSLQSRLPPTGADPLRETLSFLARHPTSESPLEALESKGFVSHPWAEPEGEGVTSFETLLVDTGNAHHFDPETGQWPNAHDHLARAITRPLAPQLDGVVFEEIAPADDEGPYLLRAYVDGDVLETAARNLGDWYDVDAVIGLVNATLRHRSAPGRAALQFVGGNDAVIVAGPGAALAELHAAGDLEILPSGGDAVEAAIQRELEIIRRMGGTPMDGQGFDAVVPPP